MTLGTIAAAIGILAGLAAIFGFVFAIVRKAFELATDVAILKMQMAEIQPVKLTKDVSWIKGALHALANVLRADLEDEPS